MKSNYLKPMMVLTAASFTVFGCASSNQNSGTASDNSLNRSETSSMGGYATNPNGKQLDVLVVEQQVMVPVATLSTTALAMENSVDINNMFDDIKDTEQYDVWSLAKSSPNLSTFVKLVEQANLVDDIQRVKEVTIFAPTNEAFAKIPQDKLKSLLTSESSAALSRLLQAHVIASDVSAFQLRENSRIRVSENTFIPIESQDRSGMNVRIGGAQVVKGDIEASNGRIHVVDSVIMPTENFQNGSNSR